LRFLLARHELIKEVVEYVRLPHPSLPVLFLDERAEFVLQTFAPLLFDESFVFALLLRHRRILVRK